MAEEIKKQKHRFNQEEDNACIAEWRRMLSIFKSVAEVDSPPKNSKDILKNLIAEAKVNKMLTQRQVEGIVARCDNFLNGSFGNTKTDLQLNAGKVK